MDNNPHLWLGAIRPKGREDNKYSHGHAVVYGGVLMTGAACMAAHAAMRIGAGLCTIVASPKAATVYRCYNPAILYEPCEKPETLVTHLRDPRRNAVLIGPGAGTKNDSGLRRAVDDIIGLFPERFCVLDADALTVFKDNRRVLQAALGPHCILTPHEGEFARIFPGLAGSRIDRAQEAARLSKAVILLKGAETVIAHPDGRVAINNNAPPDLATAGAGDVLAGIITGLLARNVPPFEAACAGAWIQGRAAQLFGVGLIATDIIDQIPAVLRELT